MRNKSHINLYYVLATASLGYLLASFLLSPQMDATYHISAFFSYLILTKYGMHLFLLIPAIVFIISAVRVHRYRGKIYQTLDFYIGALAGTLFILAAFMTYSFAHLI